MSTKVYGASDDQIEFEGEVRGEKGHHSRDEEKAGALLAFSDGTLLDIRYGKAGLGIWAITMLREGNLLLRIDRCEDEEAEIYSDVAHFKDGLKWCYAAPEWEKVS